MTDSTQARPIVEQAVKNVLGHAGTLPEIYVTQAIARFDGGYGNFRSPPHGPEGPTSNNWGAVQDAANFNQYVIWTGITNADRNSPEVRAIRSQPGPPSPKPNEFFYGSDYQKGKGWFYGPYKVYPDPVKGAEHVVKLLKRMGVFDVANRSGTNWVDVARKMHEQHYFVGYHPNDPERDIRDYARNLEAGGKVFAELFGETDPLAGQGSGAARPSSPSSSYSGSEVQVPTLRQGDTGNAVELWQRIVGGLLVDGEFGPITARATRDWQTARHLTADAIVGPKTWSKAP